MKPFDPVADLQARIRGNTDELDQDTAAPKPGFDPTAELQRSIREGQERKKNAAAQQAANTLSTTPPGDTEALKIAQGLNENGQPITPEVVQSDKPRFQQELRALQAYKALKDAPLTAQWFTSSENAQYARHDAERLAEIERMFADPGAVKKTYGGLTGVVRTIPSVFGGAVQGAAVATEVGQKGAIQTVQETVQGTLSVLERLETDGVDPDLRKRQADRLRDQAVGGYADQDLFRALMDAADDIEAGGNASAILDRLAQKQEDVTPAPDRAMYEVGTWIASRLQETLAPPTGTEDSLPVLFGEAIGSMAAFMITSALTGPAGSFSMATVLGVQEAYDRAIASGQTHDQAVKYAGGGAPAGFIQAISVEFLMRKLPIPGKRKWSVVARDIGTTAAAEAGVESLGAVMQNVNQQRYDPARGTFDDTLGQGLLAGSAAATLRGLMLALAPGARRTLFKDIERMERSKEIEQTFEALRQGLEGSELREAVPEKFRSWADSVTTGTPLETVYVSPEGLTELAQSLQDPALVERVIDALPGIDRAAYDAALRDGTDLAIPMSTWMTDVIGSDLDATLVAHVRFNPEEMTTFERVTSATRINEEILELRRRIEGLEGDGIQAELTPEEAARLEVFETARSAIAEAGFTESAAEAYAAQYAAFFGRTAARAEMPIEDFLRSFPLANINIDGTLVSMQRAPAGNQTMSDMLAAVRDTANTDPLAVQARAALATLEIDPATMSDEELLAALQADTTLEQQSRSLAPGSRALGRLLGTTTLGRGAIQFVPASNGSGPTEAALPTSIYSVTELAQEGRADVVRNTDGEPLKLFHGTNAQFSRFNDGTIFFASRRGLAVEHAMRSQSGTPRVVEAYVMARNPFVMMAGKDDPDTFWLRNTLAAESALERGHDAIIIRNDSGETVVVATSGDQIVTPDELTLGQGDIDVLPNLERSSPGRVPGVRELATKYMQDAGLPVRHQATYVTVNVERAREIARLYDEAVDSPNDPEVRAAYEALATETIAQYEALLELGYTFEWITGDDPYNTPADAIRDMQNNKHLWVFPTTEGFGTVNEASADNPLLAETEYVVDGRKALVNDLFRIVHDVFGHGSEGAAFGPRGEENAWQAHVRMFTPLAARAMTSETRGQNSWVNYGPFGERNRRDPKNTVFADQKTVLLPEWVSTVGQAEDTISSERLRADRPQLVLSDDGMVEMHHWSDQRLTVIDPNKAGTGPLSAAVRSQGNKVSFYGLSVRASKAEPGTGYVKENGLGPYQHVVRVDPARLYPWYEDPDGLKAKVEAAREEYEKPKPTGRSMATGAMEVQWYTQFIREAGYLGYYVTDNGRGSAPLGNVAVVFEALEVEAAADNDTGLVLYQSDAGSWYYSALYAAVENAKQQSATAKDWAAIIQKMPGVKKAEIEWTGVLDWLSEREGQVTRDRLLGFLRAELVDLVDVHGVEGADRRGAGYVETGREVIEPDDYMLESDIEYYGDEVRDQQLRKAADRWAIQWERAAREEAGDLFRGYAEEELEQYIRGTLETYLPDLLDDRSIPVDLNDREKWVLQKVEDTDGVEKLRQRIADRAESLARDAYYGDPEYNVFIEVGGEEYTIVRSRGDGFYFWEGNDYNTLEEVAEAIREQEGIEPEEGMTFEAKWDSYIEKGNRGEYRELLLTMPALPSEGPNASREDVDDFAYDSHYDERNVVVTARYTTRQSTPRSQNDVLFVEEVQSDLASEWRKAGGQPENMRGTKTPEEKAAIARAKQAVEDAQTAARAARDEVADARFALRVLLSKATGVNFSVEGVDMFGLAMETGTSGRDAIASTQGNPAELGSYYSSMADTIDEAMVAARQNDQLTELVMIFSEKKRAHRLALSRVSPAMIEYQTIVGGDPALAERLAALEAEIDVIQEKDAVLRRDRGAISDALRKELMDLGIEYTALALRVATKSFTVGMSPQSVLLLDIGQMPSGEVPERYRSDMDAVTAIVETAQANVRVADLIIDYNDAVRAFDRNWSEFIDKDSEADRLRQNLSMPTDSRDEFEGRPFTPFEDPLTYEVMMKRMLNIAATQGFKALAWTPGYMQAQRWSGAVQNVISSVSWNSNVTYTLPQVEEFTDALEHYQNRRNQAMGEFAGSGGIDNVDQETIAQTIPAMEAYFEMLTGNANIEVTDPRTREMLIRLETVAANSETVDRRLNTAARAWADMQAAKKRAEEAQAAATDIPVPARAVKLEGVNGIEELTIDGEGVILSKGRGRIPADQVIGKNLSELIGAQMTATILREGAGDASSSNIVIGGDGYKIAYDQVIKKFVEKFAKKYGGKVTIKEDLPAFDDSAREINNKLDVQTADTLLEVVRIILGDDAAAQIEADAKVRTEDYIQSEIDRNKSRIERADRMIAERTAEIEGYRAQGVLPEETERYINNLIQQHRNEKKAAEDFIAGSGKAEYYNERLEAAKRIGSKNALRYATDRVFNSAELREKMPELFKFPTRPVWYVEITDAMREAASQPQPLFQNNRGSIILPPRNQAPTINLFKQKDLSTLLHEMGHQYLYILQQLAADDVTSGGLGEDWQIINRWWQQNADAVAADASKTGTRVTTEQVRRYLAQKTTGDGTVDRAISVGLQEQWARGLEKYFMEGRSPSLSLRGAFRKFKAWLLGTYTDAQRLNVSISPEMIDVFDRLFATERELELAREYQGMGKLTAPDAASMGVDEETYSALLRLQEEAVAEQEERLLREIMAPLRRQKTEEYRAEKAATEERVRAEITAQPVHRLIQWLGNGRWIGSEDPTGLPREMRIDRDELVDILGEDGLKTLPRGRYPLYSNKGEAGLSVEEVANWFGFTSGDQMLTELARAPKLEDAIAAETDARLKAKGQDPMLDDSVEQAAIDALHGDKASQLLIAELRALAKSGGVKGKVTPRAQAREVARRTLGGMPVREAIRSSLYQAAERRAANEAAEALARGDRQAAFDAKQRQLVNHMMYSESRKVTELVTKVENLTGRLKRKGTRENLAGDYLEAIDEIMATYEFRRVSNRQLDRRGALAAYVKRMQEEGRENELAIPQDVLDQAERINYKQLTSDQLEGVYDTLTNIVHTARFKKKLTDAKEKREFDAIIDEVLASFGENIPRRPRNRVATDADRRRRGVRQYLNLILNATTILRKIDGGKDRGAAIRNIKARIDEATRTFSLLNEEIATKLEELYAPYTQMEMRRMSRKKRYDYVDADLSHWDIISIALNMGNVDNLERLTDPASRGYTRAQVDKLVSNLSDKDLTFVQGMWDLINSYWPQIAEREKRITGVVPKKVEAVPLEINGRMLRGGYYPIMYDGELSAQVTDEQTADLMKNILPGKFGKAQTARGHLEARKGGSGGRPLMIDISVAHRHLGRMIHDLAYSEAITSSWRILQDSRLRGAFQDAGMLDDLRTLELWLQDVGTGQLAAGDVVSRVARRVKSNFTLAKLGFNISTVMVQLTGIAQSVVVVGKKEFALAAAEYAKSPRGVAREVQALSDLMRRRETTFNKDINDILGDITRGPTEGTYQFAMRKLVGPAAFFLMQKVQYYGVDLPTWLAAYRSASARGMSQSEAVAHADETVIRAQAGGDFADRSAFERGTLSDNTRQSDLVRLFTTLGSYMFAKFNVAYERTGKMQRTLRDEGLSVKSATEVMSYTVDMALLIVLESILYAAIMGRLPDDEDDEDLGWPAFLARETALGTVAMLPFARDVAGPLQGFSAGGAYGGITETISTPILRGFVAADEGEINLSLIKSVVNALGLMTGLPSTASNRVIDSMWRSGEGEDVSPIEYLMGRR